MTELDQTLLSPEEGETQAPVAEARRDARNRLCHRRTIFFEYIVTPILAHGSHLIYAPDTVLWLIASSCCRCFKMDCSRTCGRWFQDLRKKMCQTGNIIFCIFLALAFVAFKKKGADLSCWLQNMLLGWAAYNRTLSHQTRFLSLCLMMIVRLLVANVFPFTSPVFAYLMAKSNPANEEYLGTVYLLLCSLPAGAVVPLLDYLFAPYCGCKGLPTEGMPADEYDKYFRATRLLSRMTDFLPFSFWVRPGVMDLTFTTALRAGFLPEGAAAGAVCAGHFMIWAGPATTMNQRLFVPDILTCILIQPLGLAEDVAVVLATWAGEDVVSAKKAEISLYGFMLAMNVVRFCSTRPNIQRRKQHAVVAVMTCLLCLWAYVEFKSLPSAAPLTTMTTTPTPAEPDKCAQMHSNVGQMASVVAKVSLAAIVFRLLARIFTRDFKLDESEEWHANFDRFESEYGPKEDASGVRVDDVPKGLKVTSLVPEGNVQQKWNPEQLKLKTPIAGDRALLPGDVIVEVNGIRGSPEKLRAALNDAKNIDVLFTHTEEATWYWKQVTKAEWNPMTCEDCNILEKCWEARQSHQLPTKGFSWDDKALFEVTWSDVAGEAHILRKVNDGGRDLVEAARDVWELRRKEGAGGH